MDSASTLSPGTMTVSLRLSPRRMRSSFSRMVTWRQLTIPSFGESRETLILSVCFICHNSFPKAALIGAFIE
jgi:adenylate cyclase